MSPLTDPYSSRPASGHARMEPPSSLRINIVHPALNLSGGAKSTRLIAEAMVRRGHTVTISYAAGQRRWPRPWRARAFLRHLIVRALLLGKQCHHLDDTTAVVARVRNAFIRASDVPDADVTIATWWKTAEWIVDWPTSKGIKAYFVRGHEVYGRHPERARATYRLPYLKIATSRWLQNLLATEYGDQDAVLVPNGVDWSQFVAPQRRKSRVPTVGVMYGSNWIKGADTAFMALRMAQRLAPDLSAVAFGALPIHKRHERPARLAYYLRPSQKLIPKLYQLADCWLVPSITEGFGMPGLEAAACRCPVVATRCGGPEEYIEHGVSGYLVEVGNAREMAERILDVITLPEADWRAMSEAAYSIARRFDWDRSAERLERALYAALGGRSASTPTPASGY